MFFFFFVSSDVSYCLNIFFSFFFKDYDSPVWILPFFHVQFISLQTGSGSTARKKNLIVNLMRSCREMEMKFLVRTLVWHALSEISSYTVKSQSFSTVG